jgi:hypothetical protein
MQNKWSCSEVTLLTKLFLPSQITKLIHAPALLFFHPLGIKIKQLFNFNIMDVFMVALF